MTLSQNDLPPLNILLTHFEWNLKHLEEIQKNEKTEYYQKAILQRYEFTFESAVRCIKAGAHLNDRQCSTPEECFQLAHQMGWLKTNSQWSDLVEDYQSMNPNSVQQVGPVINDKMSSYTGEFKILLDRMSALT